MSERAKGLLVVVAVALVTVLAMSALRDDGDGSNAARAPATAPAPAASAPVVAPPRAADASEARALLARAEKLARPLVGNPDDARALAQGLIAFGHEHRTRDGDAAVDRIGALLEPADGGGLRLRERHGGSPSQPPAGYVVYALATAGVPREHRFATKGGSLTLGQLLDAATPDAQPRDDATWRELAWLMLGQLAGGGQPAPELVRAALVRLEREHALIASAHDGERFAPGSPPRRAAQRQSHSDGLRLAEAVLRAGTRLPELRSRTKAQLGVLLLRYELERTGTEQLLAGDPSARKRVRMQQLELYGHLLEVFGAALELGLVDTATEGGRRIVTTQHQLVGDLGVVLSDAALLSELQPSGAAAEPGPARDGVGDLCHAIRGLRRSLPSYEADAGMETPP